MMLPFAAETHVGPIRWSDLPAPWVLTIIVIVGFLWMRALYRRERGRSKPWQRHMLAGIRTLVLIAIVLILSGPFREETTTATEPSHLVVLIDNSASMKVSDKYPADEGRRLLEGWPMSTRPRTIQDVSRGDLVRQYLAPEGEAMLRDWSRRFVLHVFAFDGDWRSLGAPPRRPGEQPGPDEEVDEDPVGTLGTAIRDLPYDGGRTRLGAILRNVANEFGRRQDRHLAGVILISDGRDTSEGESPLEVLAALGPVKEGLHVTPVLVGNPASGKNLWVERIRAKDEVLIGDEVIIETTVRQKGFSTTGLNNVEVTMRAEKIRDENGEKVRTVKPYDFSSNDLGESKRTRIEADVDLAPGDDTSAEVLLRAPFNEAGVFKVTIRAEAQPPSDAEDSIDQDNERVHYIRVRNTRIKVLYIDSQPTWDWRFLSTLLTREPRHDEKDDRRRNRFAVHVLLQGAESNYVQPASADLKPLRAFPRTRAELFKYDVIILGDVDWTNLGTTPQDAQRVCQLIVDFVEAGGGIALQSGFEYRNPLEFLETPLAQLLPIMADENDKRQSERADIINKSFRIRLTDAGKRHPIFAVVPGTADDPVATPEIVARTWAGDMPLSEEWKWWWLYRAKGGLRPGAIDLARVQVPVGDKDLTDDRGQPLVTFATMNFGKGRVLWTALDTISRIRREHRDEFYGAFWEQVIRYLATYRLLGGNTRLKIFTDKEEYFVGETATVTITALDEQFEPLTQDPLEGLHIEMPDGETIELEGDKAPKSLKLEGVAGSYRHYLPLRKHGTYRIWIEQTTRGPDGRTIRERAERRVSAAYRAKEDIETMPDLETMEAILAEANPSSRQGDVLRLPDLESFVANTQNRPRERVLERNEKTQWDKAWVLLLIVALLGIEWALRKRWQMI